jgi:hypothetical protein
MSALHTDTQAWLDATRAYVEQLAGAPLSPALREAFETRVAAAALDILSYLPPRNETIVALQKQIGPEPLHQLSRAAFVAEEHADTIMGEQPYYGELK